MMAWEPVNFIALADGLEIHADDIAMTIGKGDTALATHAWPEDGNEYAICRQVTDGGVLLATLPLTDEMREAIMTLVVIAEEHGYRLTPNYVRIWLDTLKGGE